MSDLTSRPYHPDPSVCCEACVFGRGPHAPWCEKLIVLDDAMEISPRDWLGTDGHIGTSEESR